MHRALSFLLIGSLVVPAAAADELTDAMLSVDPRDQYSTGTGRIYDQTYGPQDPLPDESLDEATDLSGYSQSLGSAYEGLRSSLYDSALPPEDGQKPKLLSPESPDTSHYPTAPEDAPTGYGY